MKPKIIVMSHGNMAKETIDSAKMIVGSLDNVYAVSMAENDGLSGTKRKLSEILMRFSKDEEILIIADLKGGTPCNVAMIKMQEFPRLNVVTGLNLAMLIEASLSLIQTSSELATYLESIGKNAIEKIELVGIVDDEEEYEE